MSPDKFLKNRLDKIRKSGRHRSMETIQTPQGASIIIDGDKMLNLCSNNYLGLANDKRLNMAASKAALEWGAGSGASRLLSGNLTIHDDLEKAVAGLVQMPQSLLFSSGYLANLGLLSSVALDDDIIFSDSLNHASIIDGCRLSRSKTVVYNHCDIKDLEKKLSDHRNAHEKAFIVTESYFSMDGDVAPLMELSRLAKTYDAGLIVDEAHAVGIWGKGGGICNSLGLNDRVFAIVGTMGKALGCQGAFVAGSSLLRDYLINFSRSMIFSTALAPSVVGAALEGVTILKKEGEKLSQALQKKAFEFREQLRNAGLQVKDTSEGHIVPVIFGKEKKALDVAEILVKEGIFARAIRPPTVPLGTSRIRFSICLGHNEGDLKRVVKILGALINKNSEKGRNKKPR